MPKGDEKEEDVSHFLLTAGLQGLEGGEEEATPPREELPCLLRLSVVVAAAKTV